MQIIKASNWWPKLSIKFCWICTLITWQIKQINQIQPIETKRIKRLLISTKRIRFGKVKTKMISINFQNQSKIVKSFKNRMACNVFHLFSTNTHTFFRNIQFCRLFSDLKELYHQFFGFVFICDLIAAIQFFKQQFLVLRPILLVLNNDSFAINVVINLNNKPTIHVTSSQKLRFQLNLLIFQCCFKFFFCDTAFLKCTNHQIEGVQSIVSTDVKLNFVVNRKEQTHFQTWIIGQLTNYVISCRHCNCFNEVLFRIHPIEKLKCLSFLFDFENYDSLHVFLFRTRYPFDQNSAFFIDFHFIYEFSFIFYHFQLILDFMIRKRDHQCLIPFVKVFIIENQAFLRFDGPACEHFLFSGSHNYFFLRLIIDYLCLNYAIMLIQIFMYPIVLAFN